MRLNVIPAAMVLLCGLGLVLSSGCSHDAAPPTAAEASTSVDQQVAKVQARSDIDDATKANIIAMLKSRGVAPPPQPISK